MSAKNLSPAKGGFIRKRWFIILVIIGIIASIVGLYYFGTFPVEVLFSNEMLITITVTVVVSFIAKVIYDSHFVDYYVETDFNNEIKVGKKKGEFSFDLESKTFYGVDCGLTKIILLQGSPANHEKKIVTPSFSKGRIFSLQSLQGRKVNRLVLRGVPITSSNTIINLGWLGNPDVEKNVNVSNKLKQLITSPDWSSVIWLAPYIPDDLYKQFLFQEKSLAEIETIYEGKTDNILREFNARIDELKNYWLHVGTEVFHESIETIKTTIESYELAAVLVTYMLKKHPSEVQDAIAALNLEAKIDSLPSVIEKQLRQMEQIKDQFLRLGAVVGIQPAETEEKLGALTQAVHAIRKRLPGTTGKPAPAPSGESK